MSKKISFSYKFCKLAARKLFSLFWGLKVVNQEVLDNWQGGIIAVNHLSLADPPIIGSVIPGQIYFVAKKELFDIPVLSGIITHLNAIPIRRGTIDRKAIDRITGIIGDGESILIFPEGSRKNFTAKPGIGKIAMQTKCNILPVYVKNSNRFIACLFKKSRLEVILGKPLSVSDFNHLSDDKPGYRDAAKLILNKILELNNGNQISS